MKQHHNSCRWQHRSRLSFLLSFFLSGAHSGIAPQPLNLCTITIHGWYICFLTLNMHPIQFCLLQICSAFPTSGGLYFWSAQLAGAKWSPFASWITGWYTSSKISFFLALPDFANGFVFAFHYFSLFFPPRK